MSVETHGTEQRVTVAVRLGGLDPEAVRVELYADPVNDGSPSVTRWNGPGSSTDPITATSTA